MPKINGIEVAKEILAVNPHQRIIFAIKETMTELKRVVELVTMTDNKIVLQALALINDCNKYKKWI
jgi:hypothetical protein